MVATMINNPTATPASAPITLGRVEACCGEIVAMLAADVLVVAAEIDVVLEVDVSDGDAVDVTGSDGNENELEDDGDVGSIDVVDDDGEETSEDSETTKVVVNTESVVKKTEVETKL